MTNKNNFAENLRRLMEARKISQVAMARMVDVSQPAISNYLRGRVPDALTLNKLAAFFGTSAELLLGTGDNPTSEPSGRVVVIRGEPIQVAPIEYIKAAAMIRTITGSFGQLGEVPSDLQILAAFSANQEVFENLVMLSTGKPRRFIDGLRTSEVFALIDAAIAVNLSQETVTVLRKHFSKH